jgi:transcriptional regulator with XRE-family HTH domain
MSDENFSYRLTRYRERHGLTKEQMGRALGVTGRYVTMIESGDKDVEPNSSLYKLFSLIEANKVPLNYEPDTHRGRNNHVGHALQETPTDSRGLGRIAASLSVEDALAQVRSDLLTIERGTPAEQRRAYVFLRDVHLPLLGQAINIET